MAFMTMLDYINERIAEEEEPLLTREEFADIRRHGTLDELEDAVEKMEAMGGYANLD